MLKEVIIESSCTAQRAEEIINKCIEEYAEKGLSVDFELIVENSAQIGQSSFAVHAVYYTVVIMASEEEE